MNTIRKDDLFTRLEALRPHEAIPLRSEAERNRALKFARERKLFFVTRRQQVGGELRCWRLA